MGLSRKDADPSPLAQFTAWFEESLRRGIPEPGACALGTSAEDGRPASRMVLLKGYDARGFVFTTNYDSRKGRELAFNPGACLLFYWQALQRQVRVEGKAERLSAAESDALHGGRPRGSQLAVWAAPQNRVLGDRWELEARCAELERAYPGSVPRPPYWGGYRLAPDRFEFWEQRQHRMHDRLRYSLEADGSWTLERLAP